MGWLRLTTLLLASAPPVAAPAHVPTVLVMPLQARNGVPPDLAETVTSALTAEAGKAPGFKVTAFREVEGLVSAEQLRVLVGCDSVSCAAEIAGAVDADFVVIGTVSTMDDELLVSLSMINARLATTHGRILERFQARNPKAILDRVPSMVDRLFGIPPRTPPTPTSGEVLRRRVALGLRVASGVVAGTSVLGMFLSLPALLTAAGVGVHDWANGYRPAERHALTQNQALLADAVLLLGGAGLAVALSLVPLALVGLALSVVVP